MCPCSRHDRAPSAQSVRAWKFKMRLFLFIAGEILNKGYCWFSHSLKCPVLLCFFHPSLFWLERFDIDHAYLQQIASKTCDLGVTVKLDSHVFLLVAECSVGCTDITGWDFYCIQTCF